MRSLSKFMLLATAAGLLDASAAHAQASAESAARDEQVGDIVVTAQRSAQNLQDVPVAVTVVSGDDLRSRKLNDLAQITAAVPSFSVGSDNSFAIRGVGSLIFTTNIDSSVGVSVDEVSLGVPLFMSNGILDDIAQIEVLQGPQGLLFGRNASAGLLNIVSNKPRFDQVGGNASIELDERDKVPGSGFGYVAKATLNLPVSDRLALRFNALRSSQNPIARKVSGSPEHFDPDQRRTAFRGKLLFEPGSGASLYIVGDYSRERGVGGVFDRTYRSAGAGGLIGPALKNADGVTPGPDNLRYGSDADAYRSVDTYGVSANLAIPLGDGLTLNNIAAWRAFDLSMSIDSDGASADLLNINNNESRYNQYSNELRLAIEPGGRLDGQLGVYAFNSELNTATVLQGSAGTSTANYIGRDADYRQTLRSLAAFGQFQYRLTDTVQLIAGGRVTSDRIAIDTRQNQRAYVVTLGPRTQPARQTYRSTNFSWKAGLQYDPTADVTAYVTYSRGYKGPSFNPNFSVAGQNLAIRPETVRDVELGIKTMLFDRRVRLNLSAFREDFRNFQVQSLNIATGISAVGNAARVRSQGIEMTAVLKPLPGLTINAGATLLDSRFRDFPGLACYLGQPDCLPNGTFNADGIRTPASARFTSNLQAIYELPAIGMVTPFVEGSYNHRSSVNFSANGSPLTRLNAFDTFGGSIGLRFDSGLEVSVFCRNCTNRIMPTSIFYDNVDQVLRRVSSTQQQLGYNSVRTVGLSASAQF
jgi:iron complex outermembrane receptor protein